jgi:prefoldin alpha subunit
MEKEQNFGEQELIYRFSLFEKQIGELQQQIEAVERGIVDLTSLNFGLNELIGSTGKEIFAPFGKGIFVKAKLISEELNVDVGDGNIIKKSIPETKELIEEQIKKLEQVKGELEANLEELGQEINKMMSEVQGREHLHEHGHKHSENCKCKDGEECNCGENCECEEEN